MQKLDSILVVSPNEQTLSSIGYSLQDNDYRIVRAGGEAEVHFCLEKAESIDAAIIDLASVGEAWLSLVSLISYRIGGKPILVLMGQADIKTTVTALKRGAYDFLLEPIEIDEIVHSLNRILDTDFKENIVRARQNGWNREQDLYLFSAESIAMREKLQQLGLMARTELPIVISGDKGVGKENLARIAHFLSAGRFQPFVKIQGQNNNEEHSFAEPFHAENGMFYRGLNTVANAKGGTLFFEEITSLPLQSQYELMDFIDEFEAKYQSLSCKNKSSIRLVSATVRNGQSSLDKSKFNPDFWERISGGIIEIPTLAERNSDIPEMVKEWLKKMPLAKSKGIRDISAQALEVIMNYSWPGNDDELEHVMEHATAVCIGKDIQADDLPVLENRSTLKSLSFNLQLHSFQLDHVEEKLINQVLGQTRGNISKSAMRLGISRGTLYNKIRKYGLEEMLTR